MPESNAIEWLKLTAGFGQERKYGSGAERSR